MSSYGGGPPGVLLLARYPRSLVFSRQWRLAVHEPTIRLLIPPDLPPQMAPGKPLPAPPPQACKLEADTTDLGPILIGVATLDGSGRVRERTLLTALGWNRGDCLEVRIAQNAAVLWSALHGCLRIDGRDQIALPSGCRAMLRIKPGERTLLAALPDREMLLVYPMPLAASLIRTHLVDVPGIIDD